MRWKSESDVSSAKGEKAANDALEEVKYPGK